MKNTLLAIGAACIALAPTPACAVPHPWTQQEFKAATSMPDMYLEAATTAADDFITALRAGGKVDDAALKDYDAHLSALPDAVMDVLAVAESKGEQGDEIAVRSYAARAAAALSERMQQFRELADGKQAASATIAARAAAATEKAVDALIQIASA